MVRFTKDINPASKTGLFFLLFPYLNLRGPDPTIANPVTKCLDRAAISAGTALLLAQRYNAEPVNPI
jgi:hypothetical protein